jgi:ribonuclease BN (tRNA processing enzyme)
MTAVSIRVLGSGTGTPTKRRAPPGLLIRAGEGEGGTILLDPGPGSLSRMAAADTPVEDVERVLLTHFHPDHTLDLLALLFARRSPLLRLKSERLVLVGPTGTAAFYDAMRPLYGEWVRAGEGEISIVEAGPGPLPEESGLRGEAFATGHTENSVGYRLSFAGRVAAFSGDAGETGREALVRLGREADLFFLECSLPDAYAPVEGHLTPEAAGRIAAEAAPRRLVLYHLYPPLDGSAALKSLGRFFKGRAEVAEDGAVFSLQP